MKLGKDALLQKIADKLCGYTDNHGSFEASERNEKTFAKEMSELFGKKITYVSIRSICYKLHAIGFLDRAENKYTFSNIMEKRLDQMITAIGYLQTFKS